MSEEEKKQLVKEYFDENVFNPAIAYGKEVHNKSIVSGVNLTRVRMFRLPTAKKMLHFFWSAIAGTDKSIKFSEVMKDAGLTRFEDIFEDVRVRFADFM